MNAKIPPTSFSRTAPKRPFKTIEGVQRFFQLTTKEVDLIRSLARVADPNGREHLEFVKLAESAPNTFIELGPALFSFPYQDTHRTHWPEDQRQTVAVENRAWAVAKCGNPELAVEIFAKVAFELPEVFIDIFIALMIDSVQDETKLIRTIFHALKKKPGFNVQDVFELINKKIERKFPDENVAKAEKEKILQSYKEVMME